MRITAAFLANVAQSPCQIAGEAMSAPHATPIDERPALLLHLADPGLMDEPHARTWGIDAEARLDAVLRQAMHEMPGAQLALTTGKLAPHAGPAGYERLRGLLGPLGSTVRGLPGDHDAVRALHALLPDWAAPITDVGAWRLVLLDSTVQGSQTGHLDATQLDLLDQAAATAAGRHLLVALHHNPVPLDNDEHEPAMLDNAPALFRRLADLPQARVVLWGRGSRAFDRRRHSLRLLASPSTSHPFAGGLHGPDSAAPGYRWLKLYRDGSLATGVKRLHPATWRALRATAQPCAA